MSSFTIRTAQPEDAPALARLLQSIGWFASFETGCPEDHAAAIAPLLKPCERQLQLLAVDAQGQVLGYCATHWLPTAILQRMGAGAKLLDQAVAAAREKGCSRIWLVNNRDRDSYLRGFYARQGWQEQPQAARFVLPL